MRKSIVLLGISILCCSTLIAQLPCGFDLRHEKLLATDPDYARKREDHERKLREYIQAHPELRSRDQHRILAPLYTIPVVVHVMHTGGAVGTIYNPSDAQILGAINYLNQVYAGTYPGMTAPSPTGAAGEIQIEFALAQRTPTCGSTNGINRVDASSLPNYTANGINVQGTGGCDEVTMKNFARWDPADYYNIWIVNKIDGADGTSGTFVAGFAYFPGAPGTLDGTVMLATQMAAGAKTLPHEIGHALDLYHPFQGSNNTSQCPVNGNCSMDGDMVCDTDPISLNANPSTGVLSFACRSGANGCASPNNYSINTESNFMSYTNCYTLFTNDQKDRMLAAMAQPSRASLVDPGNLALTPCGTPVVNFDFTGASRTEDLVGTTSGCRTYRDHVFQMVIGAAPSASATATLLYSGSAVKGLDYDVTTNGNFASPSDVLTFPNGSSTSQPFTVRLYDDANIESAESIILDFNLNNGGGDASKGVLAPTLTLNLSDNDIAPVGASSGTSPFLGTFTSSLDPQSCFRSNRPRHRVQYLIGKSELNAVGITSAANLTAMRFRVTTKGSTQPYTGFTISFANTAAVSLATGFQAGTFTQVFSQNYTTVLGNNDINFTTPFMWDGISNVLVNICFQNASADVANDVMEGYVPTGGTVATYANYLSGSTAGCSLSAASISNGRPRMTFNYNIIPTVVETVASSTGGEHISVGSNDYFYSTNNRLLMRLSGVNASLGCVNTSLQEAGTNWAAYSGGERSAKVFAVTPTTNGGTANYTIALYFDNTELDGKNPATLRIAKSSAASVVLANASNTVLVTPTVTTLGSGITVFTASFTGFSLFFLVDAGVTLPVDLVDFTARMEQRDVVLRWTTASEQNNRDFDVEVSRDGINFTRLGSLPSQGNSTSNQYYSYVHAGPGPGIYWYRLKQTDWDGQSRYSKTISLEVLNDQVKPFVYPVPARETVTINFGGFVQKATIEILSADMKTMKRETVNGNAFKKEMNVRDLPQGVYFIKLMTEDGTSMLRFIKE